MEDLKIVDQRSATRFQRVRRLIVAHSSLFSAQGSVVASWRYRDGRRLGPYYRLAFRVGGRQRSLYLGKSETVAQKIRQLLGSLQKPLRETRQRRRLLAEALTGIRQTREQMRRRLAPLGIRLKGLELRGVDAWRRRTSWGRRALELGLPLPRLVPLLDFG